MTSPMSPIPGLSLGISPSSSASSSSGLDMTGGDGGGITGAVSFGSDEDRWGRLAETGLVLIAAALAVKFLWRKL